MFPAIYRKVTGIQLYIIPTTYMVLQTLGNFFFVLAQAWLIMISAAIDRLIRKGRYTTAGRQKDK